MVNIFTVFILGLLCNYSISEIYTSISELEEVYDTETLLIKALTRYISTQEEKLTAVKRYAQLYKRQYDTAVKDKKTFIFHPVNAFQIVRYLSTAWENLEPLIDATSDNFILNLTKYQDIFKFPTNEDFDGATLALMRLQQIYRLNTSLLAKGEIHGLSSVSELSAKDCIYLSKQYLKEQNFYQANLWIQEARNRIDKVSAENVDKISILEYGADIAYKIGNINSAAEMNNEILKLNSTHKKALAKQQLYERKLGANTDNHSDKPQKFFMQYTKEEYMYKELCSEKTNIPSKILSSLKCQYTDNGIAFRKIAPFKTEEINTSPVITMFHEVISDSDITIIKHLAQPLLIKTNLHKTKSKNSDEYEENSVSKTAFLKNTLHERINVLNQRMEHMTGLSTNHTEDLQVINYGIAGYSTPHHDSIQYRSISDKLATVLFYLSDVEMGGATIFPLIQTKIWPKRGSAIHWHNFHSNGKPNLNMEYGDCPVLFGSKWVMMKRLRKMGRQRR